MIEELVKRFIYSNKKFYSNRLNRHEVSKKVILVNVGFLDPFAVISSLKIAAAISEVLGGQLHVVPHFKASSQVTSMIESFLPKEIFSIKFLVARAFISKFFHILTVIAKLKSGQDVESLKDGKLEIGLHIYDSMLARMKLTTIGRLTVRHKLQIVFDLTYYFAIKRLFDSQKIDFVVLPDNTYRDGLVYEVMKSENIPCIVGVDLNGVSVHKNSTLSDYDEYCRAPDSNLINDLMQNPKILHATEQYASLRFSGKEMQHDTMRAFSESKAAVGRDDLYRDYGLIPNRKIVLVMAHVFCDAPHALPGLLFKDFEEWLIETCKRLADNSNIDFVVKEHPSASLYGEDGYAESVLEKIGLKHKLLASNVHTGSLFDCVDVMVTCGGTGGMEFPCFGVPVLIAARPAYSQFPYVVCPKTKEEFLLEIDMLQDYQRLNDELIRLAKVVLYTINLLMKVSKKEVGLGSQEYYRGINFDINLFLEEMISDCNNCVGYCALIQNMTFLLNGPYKNLYRHGAVVE